MKTADFPRLLAAFFTDRLMQQLQASPHTIASYRDTFRLLVRHARKMLKKAPTELELGDLDTDFLGAFLSHLEDQRGNDARTRNTRLAAIRSFFGYVASHEPQHAALAQRVLAMPNKRHTRRSVDFLNRDEVEALLRAPDLRTRAGRRVTARCCSWRCKPDCERRNSSVCAAGMSSSAPVPICVAMARDARNAVRRYARTRRQRCGTGWRNFAASRTPPSSRINAAAFSVTTDSTTCSPSIWPLHGPYAPR